MRISIAVFSLSSILLLALSTPVLAKNKLVNKPKKSTPASKMISVGKNFQPLFMISHAEFMKLSTDKQKKYIRELRKIAVEFAKKNPLAAKQMAKENSLFAALVGSLITEAHADDQNDIANESLERAQAELEQNGQAGPVKQALKQAEERKDAAYDKIESLKSQKQDLQSVVIRYDDLQKTRPLTDVEKRTLLRAELDINRIEIDLRAANSDYQNSLKDLRTKLSDHMHAVERRNRAQGTARESNRPVSPEAPRPADPVNEAILQSQNPAPVAPSTPSPSAAPATDPLADAVNNATRNSDIPTPVPPATAAQETPAVTPGAGTPAAAQVPAGDVRCMFGGFVIYGDACTSVESASSPLYGSSISAAATVEEGAHKFVINPNELKCAGGSPEDRVLCNPLIFGTRKDGKAICVTQAKNSTALCQNESAKDDDLSVASAVALAKANPAAWNALAASWDNLCKEEKIANNRYLKGRVQAQQDVKDTCAAAKSRFQGVERALSFARRPPTQSPETPQSATPAPAPPAQGSGAINEGNDPGHAH